MSGSTVIFICARVFRVITQRVRLTPSTVDGRCSMPRRRISMRAPVVLPEPTGPMMMRTNASESMKDETVGGAVKLTDIYVLHVFHVIVLDDARVGVPDLHLRGADVEGDREAGAAGRAADDVGRVDLADLGEELACLDALPERDGRVADVVDVGLEHGLQAGAGLDADALLGVGGRVPLRGHRGDHFLEFRVGLDLLPLGVCELVDVENVLELENIHCNLTGECRKVVCKEFGWCLWCRRHCITALPWCIYFET